jgi:DNA replication protein DnaC
MKKASDQLPDLSDFEKTFGGIKFATEDEIKELRSLQRDEQLSHRADIAMREVGKIMPPVFKDTDVNLLPPEQFKKCKKYADLLTGENTSGKYGLIMHGTTGKCKTRICWEIIKHIANKGIVSKFETSVSMQEALTSSYGKKEREKIVSEFKNTKILFIDDWGKEKSTERWESDLFDILDYRFSWKKVTVFTMNTTGHEIVKKFIDPEAGQAIKRRMVEFCYAVAF